MDPIKTGNLISSCRKEKGLTQVEFAQILNISNRTVSKWENGDGFPDITLLPQIAEVLGITTDELLAGEISNNTQGEPEILFKVVYPQKYKLVKEFYKLRNADRTPRMYTIILIISLIALVVVALTIEMNTTTRAFFCLAFAVCLPCLLLYILSPCWLARLNLRMNRTINGGKLCDDEVTISDKITIRSGKQKYTFELSDVTGFYEKKNMYIFRFNKRTYTFIAKDSFVTGNADDFVAFIRANMTVVNEKNTIKNFNMILMVSLATLIVIMCAVVAIVKMNAPKEYSYEQYIAMSTDELKELDDENLYSAIEIRVDEKFSQEEPQVNDCETVFYTVNDFYYAMSEDGFCSYLFYYAEGSSLKTLYASLNKVGLSDLSQKVKVFVDENEIDPMQFNSKADYDKMYEKYNFKDFDKSVEYYSIKTALMQYAHENIDKL